MLALGGDTTCSRCCRLTAVFVVLLLCVLLLAAITVQWIKFYILNTENKQLQTSYNNLTKERDQLQSSYNNLTKEKDQLQKSYRERVTERDRERERERERERVRLKPFLFCCHLKEFIGKQLGNFETWIGLSDEVKEREWKWVDGTTLNTSFSYWAEGEPNNAGEEDCAVISGSIWNDRKCSDKLPWICEKPVFQ
ncbi:hypothetical protein QTP70_020383 [Hemibagrus guttatus]|uniref:C-type lectin domain-containing protein n=1 Tax=Hemibagrus guttatus TaxID=175788 RepID=A0AAE0UHW6_9TELE|nr:hypothetical protein QTP70_020383 [Hemibagrus guttatus]